jgi:hypothetical protein
MNAIEALNEWAVENGTTVARLRSRGRKQPDVEVRDRAIRFMRDELRMSLLQIGRMLGRDHTTVMYSLQKTGGTGEPVVRYSHRRCDVDGCGRKHYGKGWCQAHYNRLLLHGDVHADVPIGSGRVVDPPVVGECEVCGDPSVGRWCGIGRCLEDASWSWSRVSA